MRCRPCFPHDWKGGLALLAHGVRAVELPRQHRSGVDRRHGGAARVSGKVHIGYLAGIVAASNAGGAGSVVGDTTTTMMWIAGVSPLSVLEAYVAAFVAFLIFAVPASMQQHRFSPILKKPPTGLKVDRARVFIVAAILIAALLANVIANLKFPALLDAVPVLGLAVWVVILADGALASAGLDGDA